VDGLLDQIPASTLAEWAAYDHIEPILTGSVIAESAANQMALLANIHRSSSQAPFQAADFLPGDQQKKPEKSAGDTYAELKLWAQLNQGAMNRKQ